jgi:hypothetical protein
MLECKHLKHKDLFVECDDNGNEMVLWVYKKTNKRGGTVTALAEYNDTYVNLNKPIEIANDSKFNGEFRIIGNIDDYPEYLI